MIKVPPATSGAISVTTLKQLLPAEAVLAIAEALVRHADRISAALGGPTAELARPQAESTAPRKSTSFGGRYSPPMPLKMALQVSSVSPRTRAMKSLVSSRAPGADVERGGAL